MSNRERHRIHANPFSVRGDVNVPDWQQVYGRDAAFALDVGFGEGRFLLSLAKAHPEWNVLGLEIRQHLVADVMQQAGEEQLTNVHALVANANLHLDMLIPDHSLAFVSVNFPDPWFKTRHHKRRVVNVEWMSLLAKKMIVGGVFHYMSDYAPGAMEALVIAEQNQSFKACSPGFASESTTGWTTVREGTHLQREEPIYRFAFVCI